MCSLMLSIILALSLSLSVSSTLFAFVALQKGKEKSQLPRRVISETCVGSSLYTINSYSHSLQSQYIVTVNSHSLQSQLTVTVNSHSFTVRVYRQRQRRAAKWQSSLPYSKTFTWFDGVTACVCVSLCACVCVRVCV